MPVTVRKNLTCLTGLMLWITGGLSQAATTMLSGLWEAFEAVRHTIEVTDGDAFAHNHRNDQRIVFSDVGITVTPAAARTVLAQPRAWTLGHASDGRRRAR